MISSMEDSPASILCKSCGLCCSGHLFTWTKLRSAELDSIQSLGLKVIREPQQRGFSQPCPLWQGQCTIYESPQYPRFCHTYKCKLLKQLLEENIQLPEALQIVQDTFRLIAEVKSLLPTSPSDNFRERLAAQLEQGSGEPALQSKADELLRLYAEQFGVNDFLE